jgi:hypothetical protein
VPIAIETVLFGLNDFPVSLAGNTKTFRKDEVLDAPNPFDELTRAAASTPPKSVSLPAKTDVMIYLGAGSFWHTQNEMVTAENQLLGRDMNSYTAVTGYAGGSKVGPDDKVCDPATDKGADQDYSKLGHAQVVALKVPPNRVNQMMEKYVDLFSKDGKRADPKNKGGGYRSVVGLPGGMSNPVVASVLAPAAAKKGMKVKEGDGDDKDTIKEKSILVYDTAEFPFYQAEIDNQYHDDLTLDGGWQKGTKQGYGQLRPGALSRGAFKATQCKGDGAYRTGRRLQASEVMGDVTQEVPSMFIAALGDLDAASGTGADKWGIWTADPGPQGVQLDELQTLEATNGVTRAGWELDPEDWWLSAQGQALQKPRTLPPGMYRVKLFSTQSSHRRLSSAGSMETVLTIHPDHRWELEGGSKLQDVVSPACQAAHYAPMALSGRRMSSVDGFPAFDGLSQQEHWLIGVTGMVDYFF